MAVAGARMHIHIMREFKEKNTITLKNMDYDRTKQHWCAKMNPWPFHLRLRQSYTEA